MLWGWLTVSILSQISCSLNFFPSSFFLLWLLHTYANWWFFTEVWVTTNLLRSTRFFLVSELILLWSGCSWFFIWFQVHTISFPRSWEQFQVLEQWLLSPSPSCSINCYFNPWEFFAPDQIGVFFFFLKWQQVSDFQNAPSDPMLLLSSWKHALWINSPTYQNSKINGQNACIHVWLSSPYTPGYKS